MRPVAEASTQDGRYLAEEASHSDNTEQKAETETPSIDESVTQRFETPDSQSRVPRMLDSQSSLGAVEIENEIVTSNDVSGIDESEDVVVKNGEVSQKDVVSHNEALNSNVELVEETDQKEDSDVEHYHNAHENLPEIEETDVKQDKVVEQNGFEPTPAEDKKHESEEKTETVVGQTAEQSKQASLEASTFVAPKAPTDTDARDPPPLLFDDDDEDDEDR